MLRRMSELARKSCEPCRAGAPPLAGDQLRDLARQLDRAWSVVDGHHLERRFALPDFAASLALANEIGELAEREGHHPDLLVRWGELVVTLWTHKAGGLTEADFVLAAKVDELAARAASLRAPRT
jgi:4a-hydroxytetrahydrobiopterin dehydratase